MKRFETLIEDVQKLFDGQDLSETIQQFSDRLGQSVRDRFIDYGVDREPTLRMSNLGKPLRQLWYDLKGYKGEPLSPETRLKFLYGAILEELFLYLAIQAGHTVERMQEKVEYDGVPGHIDAIIDGVLIDVKSCSTYSFAKFSSGSLLIDGNDPFGYVGQLSAYKEALKAERAAFIAIDKTVGKICSLELPASISYPLSEKISATREVLQFAVPPARCYEDVPDNKSGNRKLAVGCSYCAHKSRCWEDSNEGQGLQVRYFSTGPRYFTKLVKEPRINKNSNEDDTFESFSVKEI